jgi:hypothetical protein
MRAFQETGLLILGNELVEDHDHRHGDKSDTDSAKDRAGKAIWQTDPR